MGRTPSYTTQGWKKGPWSCEEDQLLINYINKHGYRDWRSLPKNAGLQRCGLSCRLRWANYLAAEIGTTPFCDKKGLKKGEWSSEEDELLINYINQHGHGNWSSLPKNAGLQRNGVSCRRRWTNYLAGKMGRTPCRDKQALKKEPWSSEEDELLINYINQHGHGTWTSLPENAGVQRCGDSCKLRWTNYLAGEMGRTPCPDKQGLKKGPWSSEEDEILVNYINEHGHGTWTSLPKYAGLHRNGKSCRLRWTNYLMPGIKHGLFTPEEENLVIQLHKTLGNRWAAIAIQLPGRTDNDIKNLWRTHLRKRLVTMGLDPQTHEPTSKTHGPKPPASPSTHHKAQRESSRLEAEARFLRESLIYKYGPHCSSSSCSDVYLRLWDSEVGESFRKVVKKKNTERSTCQSPVSETSSSTTRHKAQWESARLEAEARLSKQSLIYKYSPLSSSSSYSDPYLRLWNSEVGKSFRKVVKKENTEKSTCQGLVSETSYSTKCASSSGLTQRDEDIEVIEDSKSHIQDLNERPNSAGSHVVDDSSVSELLLLLDFPENNDMSLLENDIYDYLSFCDLSND